MIVYLLIRGLDYHKIKTRSIGGIVFISYFVNTVQTCKQQFEKLW